MIKIRKVKDPLPGGSFVAIPYAKKIPKLLISAEYSDNW